MTSLGREQVAAQRVEKGSVRNYGSLGVKVQPVSCVVNVKKTCCVLAYRRIDDKRTSYKENMGVVEQGREVVRSLSLQHGT